MEDKDWLALKIISEEKNITRAAERLYVSQPALTYRLKNMENEFNAKIFTRTPNGVHLTPQGEYLLSYADEMLLRFQKTKEVIQNMDNKIQGTLRLGSSSIFAHYELPQILRGFLEQYPDVEISLKTGLSRPVNRMLQKEEVSIAIVRGDYHWAEEKQLIFEEPLCLVSSRPIEFDDLPRKPQIDYMTDSSLKPLVEEWWRESFSQPPLVTMAVDSMDTCRQLVVNGLGWAILPQIGLRHHHNLYTKALHWRNGQPINRRTWMMYPASSLELSTVRTFVEYTRKYYNLA